MIISISIRARSIRRATATLALFAGIGLIAPARAAMEKTSLAQTPAIMPFLAAYIAEDAGIWRDNGLDVKVINLDGVATVNAVISGSADFALSSSTALTRAAAHGQRLLALLSLNDQSGQVTVIRKDIAEAAHFNPAAPLAERAQIIKGHIVSGGSAGSVADVFLKAVAKAGGIDQSEFTNPPLAASELLAAFSRHAVDGFSYSLPYPQQAVAAGDAVVVADGTSHELPQFLPIAAGLVMTRPQLCAEHRSLCEKMGHSFLQATQFLQQRHDDAKAILKKRFSTVSDAVLELCFAAVLRITNSPPTITAAAFANGDRMNAEAGFLKPEDRVSSYDGLFTNEFLK
ncbi:MAG TPA: ABC transporter substrate-binding protein [Stellaceae bacterium]|jgi:ABC-type nitrate/sulfonate/bicarbonate transport system substrate-binding protein